MYKLVECTKALDMKLWLLLIKPLCLYDNYSVGNGLMLLHCLLCSYDVLITDNYAFIFIIFQRVWEVNNYHG